MRVRKSSSTSISGLNAMRSAAYSSPRRRRRWRRLQVLPPRLTQPVMLLAVLASTWMAGALAARCAPVAVLQWTVDSTRLCEQTCMSHSRRLARCTHTCTDLTPPRTLTHTPKARPPPPRRALQLLHHHVPAGPRADLDTGGSPDALRVRSPARPGARAAALFGRRHGLLGRRQGWRAQLQPEGLRRVPGLPRRAEIRAADGGQHSELEVPAAGARDGGRRLTTICFVSTPIAAADDCASVRAPDSTPRKELLQGRLKRRLHGHPNPKSHRHRGVL
jgi:hypothetical protein